MTGSNELVERRGSRLLGVTAGLSGALWALVLIGAAINIAVTWCFHLRNQRMHFWMRALISSLLGLMIFLLAVNGSSILCEDISVSGTFSACLR
jgi:O-antigen/teichoic acid export membrane protein